MAISLWAFQDPVAYVARRVHSLSMAPLTPRRSDLTPPKSRNPVMAHALTSPQAPCRRGEKTRALRLEGLRALTGSIATISAGLWCSRFLPIPIPSSDDDSSSRAALYHNRQQERHDAQPPEIDHTITYRVPRSSETPFTSHPVRPAECPGRPGTHPEDGHPSEWVPGRWALFSPPAHASLANSRTTHD